MNTRILCEKTNLVLKYQVENLTWTPLSPKMVKNKLFPYLKI